ncbi:flagellar basal body rod protein FlgB [uncultured Enterovirga sp.]|uniref:flagellar basal body rod protein FlgB n=1 Tax=uncultured Enterovirga sp. TaxID=2026352 RepID=UPI0035CA533F
MSMTSLPIVSLLRERMQWHQSRQKVLAENVANANTPGFKPKDLVPPAGAKTAPAPGVSLVQTSRLHLAASGASDPAATRNAKGFETTPSGNAVNLEDEMMKVAENQSEYQLAASLYQKSLAMLRTAAGVRGG